MIAIIDYGMGNLRSVQKALELVAEEVIVTNSSVSIEKAGGIVLPGVGAFKDAIQNLEQNKLARIVTQEISKGKPFLGICLGLDLLFTWSREDGFHKGLNVIEGGVVRLPDKVKVPHIGWNQINKKTDCPIFKGIPDGISFYFVHSYYVEPEDQNVIATTTDYGIEFTSSIWKDNVYAVQFHPEKSSKWGLQVLKNFAEVVKKSKFTVKSQESRVRSQ